MTKYYKRHTKGWCDTWIGRGCHDESNHVQEIRVSLGITMQTLVAQEGVRVVSIPTTITDSDQTKLDGYGHKKLLANY